jgi:hypothetical protein
MNYLRHRPYHSSDDELDPLDKVPPLDASSPRSVRPRVLLCAVRRFAEPAIQWDQPGPSASGKSRPAAAGHERPLW